MRNFIVILDGPMGAGKSTIGALLHSRLRRTALVHLDTIKWFVSDFRRSKRDNAITNGVLMKMWEEYLKQGINLIIPQGFMKKKRLLSHVMRLGRKAGASIYLYHLNAPREVLLERIEGRPKSERVRTPIAKSRIHNNIRAWKEGRYSLGKEFATDAMNPQGVVREILKDVVEKKYIIKG